MSCIDIFNKHKAMVDEIIELFKADNNAKYIVEYDCLDHVKDIAKINDFGKHKPNKTIYIADIVKFVQQGGTANGDIDVLFFEIHAIKRPLLLPLKKREKKVKINKQHKFSLKKKCTIETNTKFALHRRIVNNEESVADALIKMKEKIKGCSSVEKIQHYYLKLFAEEYPHSPYDFVYYRPLDHSVFYWASDIRELAAIIGRYDCPFQTFAALLNEYKTYRRACCTKKLLPLAMGDYFAHHDWDLWCKHVHCFL